MTEKVYRTELTPVSFLRRSAYMFPDKEAVVHGDRPYPYREFEERVTRLASPLKDEGFEKGDRIAFLCPNIPPMLEGTFAIPAAGLVMVAINTRLGAGEVEYIVEHSKSKMVFVDHELEELLEGIDESVQVVRIDDTGEEGDPYEDYLAEGSPEPVESVLEDEEEMISVNYTSGTTGQPKGVMYNHRGAYISALGNVIETQMDYETRYLWTLPMFHCNGWTYPWAVTAVAGTHVCLRKVEPGMIWDLFESENISHYCAAPTVQIPLANDDGRRELDHQVTAAIAGYVPADLVRVVDDEMNDVPLDGETMGEIVMHGNMVMKGYLDNEEETKESFKGGWYHSGVLAVWHPDGYIEIKDRDKDVIISGGENISSIEVEQVVAEHPSILEAAVTAMPDEHYGERPKAFVTLKQGEKTTEEEIIDFVKERIARFKAPAAVEFMDELPKTSTGKVQKYVLREREEESQDGKANGG